MTAPPTSPPRHAPLKKRIIVCCDGTWQDGLLQQHQWQYTNVMKISRIMDHQDNRCNPPIHQVVFYQTGVGSEQNFYSTWVEGATGASLAEKVQEAYGFVAHNYQPGDEIFLFGFSRGAYTARMVAAFIGEIGVLDKRDMNHFADIFIAFQKRGNTNDGKEKEELDKTLEKWSKVMENGRSRADPDKDGFTIKCVGVFDTVGSLGLPKEISPFSSGFKQLFGFHDKLLGHHIQYAFHAMALNETREDFDIAKYQQTQKGREKGQVLKQVWFAGSHADIGGGWRSHDLSDLSLAWMVSEVEGLLAIDRKYLHKLPNPVDPWGQQLPHDPASGVFRLAHEIHRTLPTTTDEETHEYIHPSVVHQKITAPQVTTNVKSNPALVCELNDLEIAFKANWPYVPGKVNQDNKEAKEELALQNSMQKQLEKMVVDAAKESLETEVMVDEGGRPRYQPSWLGSILNEITSWTGS